jgi:peptide/nickel transport system permease protein
MTMTVALSPPPRSRLGAAARVVLHDRVMLWSLLLLLLLVAVSVFAPLLTAHDPALLSPRDRLKGVPLGTDSSSTAVACRSRWPCW